MAVDIDGGNVLSRSDVRTRMQVGFAVIHRVQLAGGRHSLAVTIDGGRLHHAIDLEVSSNLYVGISLDNGTVRHRTSTTPFGYA